MLLSNNINNQNKEIDIKIGREIISQQINVKFLGITINNQLNWKEHINLTRNKVAKISYCINSIKNILPFKYKTTLYDSLIKPHLEYGIIFRGRGRGPRLSHQHLN